MGYLHKMTENIDWKNIDNNSVQALRYVCQQHQVYPSSSNKNELVKCVTNIRDNLQNQKKSEHSSSSSSRQQSPVITYQNSKIPIQPKINRKKFNLLQFLRTPNPIVLTVAIGALITSLLWIFVNPSS